MIRIAMIGDIVGRPGRKILQEKLPRLIDEHHLDAVIANGENAAGGFGITPEIAEDIFQCGVDVITSGNHIWDQKKIEPYIEEQPRLLRPANYPAGNKGRGDVIISSKNVPEIKIGVISLSGRIFMGPLDCPFQTVVPLIEKMQAETKVVIIDFHAEATSEKMAMAWYLDGRVSALVGTHTHVQTADERLLPGGTAYITDLGMTGPMDSVIGMKEDRVISKFLTARPNRFEVASGNIQLHGVLIEVDEEQGVAQRIARIKLKF